MSMALYLVIKKQNKPELAWLCLGAVDKIESLVHWPLGQGQVRLGRGGCFRAGGHSAAQWMALRELKGSDWPP